MPARVGTGSPISGVGVGPGVAVAFSDSPPWLLGAAGAQAIAIAEIAIMIAAEISNVMWMGCMIFTFRERTVRQGLWNWM